MDELDLDWFLGVADGLLAIPSTADRPAELHRALEYVLDFAGPGFAVQRFESGAKPSALLYADPGGRGGPEGRGWDAPFRIILNGHLDVVPAPDGQFQPRREGDRLYARVTGCTRGAPRT